MTLRTLIALTLSPALFLLSPARSFAANNWTNTSSGLWRTAANWSLATAPNGTSAADPTQITNAATKTVTIDSGTVAANLSLRGLTMSAPVGSTNTLQLLNVPLGTPLTTSKALLVGNRGTLQIINSAVSPTADFDVVGGALDLQSGSLTCALNCDLQDGSMVVSGGTLTATAGATGIRMGRFAGANANMTINNGTVNILRMTLGSVSGSQSSLTLAGGNLICAETFSAAQLPATTGNVTMTGGNLLVTNGTTKIADRATATFSQSGGNSAFADLSIGDLGVGSFNLSAGVMTVTPRTNTDLTIVGNQENGDFNQSGGVAIIRNELHVADFGGVTGNLNITGGQFFATNDLVAIGRYGFGTLTVSNALVVLTNTSVGRHPGAVGTLTVQSNANVHLLADLSIGRLGGAVGQVFVTAGLLSVTNDDIWVGRAGSGEMTVSGGSVHAKSFHVGESDDGTNAPIGNFTVNGGLVLVSSNFVAGTPLLSTGHVAIASGTLTVTNAARSAFAAVRAGDFTMNGGVLNADSLVVTNTDGSFIFNAGTLQAKALTVSNGQPFVVGDGVNPATLQLQGGTYTFTDGLVISSNATVSGCGTVIGSISNNGTYTNPCGQTPTVSITSLNKTGATAAVSFSSVNGLNHVLEFKNSLGDFTWTPIPPAVPGNGSVMTLTDGAATNVTRFYRIHAQ